MLISAKIPKTQTPRTKPIISSKPASPNPKSSTPIIIKMSSKSQTENRMELDRKQTLADIARPKNPQNRGRKRNRTPQVNSNILTNPLNEEKLKNVEKLFANAKTNIAKIEEEKLIRQPVKQEIVTTKVKIENGKVVIDRDAMMEACAQKKIDPNELVRVSGSDKKFRGNKKKHNERWNEEETQLFYTALQMFGTDFEMISNFMQNRNRNQIKSKYKKESKINPIRIDHAIWNRIDLSKEAYENYIETFRGTGEPKGQED